MATERTKASGLVILLVSSSLAVDHPNPKLTPGEVRNVSVRDICQPGYSKRVRNTTPEMKREVFRRYGVKYFPHAYQTDHLVALCLGGADTLNNLWPQDIAEAVETDKLEHRLCRDVCAGRISLQDARTRLLKAKGAQ